MESDRLVQSIAVAGFVTVFMAFSPGYFRDVYGSAPFEPLSQEVLIGMFVLSAVAYYIAIEH